MFTCFLLSPDMEGLPEPCQTVTQLFWGLSRLVSRGLINKPVSYQVTWDRPLHYALGYLPEKLFGVTQPCIWKPCCPVPCSLCLHWLLSLLGTMVSAGHISAPLLGPATSIGPSCLLVPQLPLSLMSLMPMG